MAYPTGPPVNILRKHSCKLVTQSCSPVLSPLVFLLFMMLLSNIMYHNPPIDVTVVKCASVFLNVLNLGVCFSIFTNSSLYHSQASNHFLLYGSMVSICYLFLLYVSFICSVITFCNDSVQYIDAISQFCLNINSYLLLLTKLI